MNNLLHLIHGHDIYQNFDFKKYNQNLIGWNIDHNLFKKLITNTNPKIILELGSWYGASAISMGKIIKELKLDCQIICVDTWLGSEEFIGLHEKDPERKLLPTFGYPNAYYQFLANICHNELQDIIIPFPQVIKIACQWLSKKNINADIVYIDGNNDTIDVYNDMTYSWPILNNNGIIFGDDYNNSIWRSINLGVNKFCAKNRVKLTETTDFPNHWFINKKQKSNDSDHLILITCTYNHTNRIAYFRYLIKNIFTKINNYTWIIIEDGITTNDYLDRILKESGVNYKYLHYGPTKSGGNAQRNFALEYIHDCNIDGIIYNLDDDNLYDLKLFNEIRKIKNISIFPVHGWNRDKNNPEKPILDNNNNFKSWNSAWQRKYSTDMGGFAFRSSLLKNLKKPFWTYADHGGGESEFIDRLVKKVDDIEFNLCNNCNNCYVSHNELRNIHHPDIDSIEVNFAIQQTFNTKYGHSDNSINTFNIISKFLLSEFTQEQIDKILLTLEEIYFNTEGSFGGPDRIEAASIIKNLSKTKEVSTILELGAWKGRVSLILNLFKANKNSTVISVDDFYSENGLDKSKNKQIQIKSNYTDNLLKFNIKDSILIDSNVINIEWIKLNMKPISYIYYDINLEVIDAIKVLESLLPVMQSNVIIEFHDSSWKINEAIIEHMCINHNFIKLYKIDIWEGSLVIQRN
jgi:hypothetical protein